MLSSEVFFTCASVEQKRFVGDYGSESHSIFKIKYSSLRGDERVCWRIIRAEVGMNFARSTAGCEHVVEVVTCLEVPPGFEDVLSSVSFTSGSSRVDSCSTPIASCFPASNSRLFRGLPKKPWGQSRERLFLLQLRVSLRLLREWTSGGSTISISQLASVEESRECLFLASGVHRTFRSPEICLCSLQARMITSLRICLRLVAIRSTILLRT